MTICIEIEKGAKSFTRAYQKRIRKCKHKIRLQEKIVGIEWEEMKEIGTLPMDEV